MKIKKIKAQRGVTYECYRGFTDTAGSRARRGQRYVMMSDLREYYYMISPSGTGYGKLVPKEEFASRFIPLNPLDAVYLP
jgi:hypothetical protein